jgi:hypothetical protein
MNLDDDSPYLHSYLIAALENDAKEMAAQSDWFEGRKDLQHEILSEEADAASLCGASRPGPNALVGTGSR